MDGVPITLDDGRVGQVVFWNGGLWFCSSNHVRPGEQTYPGHVTRYPEIDDGYVARGGGSEVPDQTFFYINDNPGLSQPFPLAPASLQTSVS